MNIVRGKLNIKIHKKSNGKGSLLKKGIYNSTKGNSDGGVKNI